MDDVKISQVIDVQPGDRFVLKATDGELHIDGVDDPALIRLAQAVDIFFITRTHNQQARESAVANLRIHYNALSDRVKDQFVQYVRGGMNGRP